MKMKKIESNNKFYFEKIIGFDEIIGLRVFSKKSWVYQGKEYNFFNKYFYDYESLQEYIDKANLDKNLNCYVSINPKKEESGKKSGIAAIKNIVFDIEAADKKPLTDKDYQMKLSKTVKWLESKLGGYGLRSNCRISSGRGIHLYFSFKSGVNIRHEKMIKKWYDKICIGLITLNEVEAKESGDDNPIKIDKQCNDSSHVFGLIGTQNIKYTEKSGFRRILKLDENLNDGVKFIERLEEELKDVMIKQSNRKIKSTTSKSKYTERTIWNAPEVRLLLDYDDVPEGLRHTHIILPIKLLLRENDLDMHEEIAEEIESAGYNKPNIDDEFNSDEYSYSNTIFRSWCFRNWDWCSAVNYKLPFTYKKKLYYSDRGKLLPLVDDFTFNSNVNSYKKVDDWFKLVDSMKQLNQDNMEFTEDRVNYSKKTFDKFIETKLSERLKKFVKQNDLLEYLRSIR